MQSALDVTARRFPSISVRLKRGLFWYYLEEMPSAPEIAEEKSHPISRMDRKQIKSGALRVIVYKNRLAVEFFHALTDGTGGMIFLKSLSAEYILQKYGKRIPCESGVLDRLSPPTESELEDSFLKNARGMSKSRAESEAYKLPGKLESRDFLWNTTMITDSSEALEKAKEHGVTLTAFMCSALMLAICNVQEAHVKNENKYKPVKILLPVNLRKIFKSESLRNFALYVIPEINPRIGKWTFDEICQSVHHQMKLTITEKEMRRMLTTNVNSERSVLLKIVPLFIKNIAMKTVFNLIGERTCCLTLSNLGDTQLPCEMREYISRMDFILGAPASSPSNCGMLSYNGTLYINFTRKTRDPDLERAFFEVLRDLGLKITVESNTQNAPDPE
jgi:NRPS condensation-like uncharacterized protein